MRELITSTRRARKLSQRYKYRYFRAEYDRIRNKMKPEIRLYKDNTFQIFLQNLNTADNNPRWRTTKHVLKEYTVDVTLLNHSGTWIRRNADKGQDFPKNLLMFSPQIKLLKINNSLNMCTTI